MPGLPSCPDPLGDWLSRGSGLAGVWIQSGGNGHTSPAPSILEWVSRRVCGPGDEGWAPRRRSGDTLQLAAGSLLRERGAPSRRGGLGAQGLPALLLGRPSLQAPQLNSLSCRRHLAGWALPAGPGGLGALGACKEELCPRGSQRRVPVCLLYPRLPPHPCPQDPSAPLLREKVPACWGRHYMGQPLGGPKTPETGHQLGPVLSLPRLLRTHSRERRWDVLPQPSRASGPCHLTRHLPCGLFPYLLLDFRWGSPEAPMS